ncbi:hypothetical protein PUNSTDRAFT_101425 [Punctularia strigosozonata HHB-11173 SS5]|uniref:uncharacterized protein n=1 Tax=Punctularia strigosozonata (strain HHB-11173) TaxID=741275 RepID=UPI00044180B1|nr:uncharacterized protein PUNSTDRAFT_101425 [Punctularia strigosozonata HHB-11173 SS5]EIN09557.1 hypothetical protein PUNSTDRAFT_101425 [Punctularia strigosozonata HHB-11173 SS5]
MASLNNILKQLESNKITARQAGLTGLREYFAKEHHILSLDEEGNCKAWIVVFQKLFKCVETERDEVLKKNSRAAMDRLSNAASAVRWLIGKCRHRLNTKAVKVLYQHLIQYMIHRGELHGPVGLDYIKAFRSIYSWRPHMDHIDPSTWVKIVRIGFNVILGDPLSSDLTDAPPDFEDQDEKSVVSDMYEDDDDDEENHTDATVSSHASKKRRRGASRGLPTPKKMRGTPRPQHQTVTLEQIEFMSLLALMMNSSSAPFLSPDYPQLPSALLQRFGRFLKVYPTDTSLRHDYLLALSATLGHLSLNKTIHVRVFALSSWDGLISMWDTKNKNMKETLIGVLKILFPFLSTSTPHSSRETRLNDGIYRLWKVLDGEAANRQGTDGLSLACLRLDVQEGETDSRAAFVAGTFRHGWNFDPSQALAWVMLELQADCIAKLYESSESVHGSANISNEGKQSALDNPVTFLLQSIDAQSPPTVRAYRLQILLFLIDRHWTNLHLDLQRQVIDTLLQFISGDDATVQSFIFLCFAAIARHGPSTFAGDDSDTLIGSTNFRSSAIWDTIWTHALRRVNSPIVCRAACHAASVLLTYARDVLTSNRVLAEVEAFAKDLDVQGPSYPYDSVCRFLSICLHVASQDVRLFRMQLEEKALSWLIDTWQPSGLRQGNRSREGATQSYLVGDILGLMERICSMSQPSGVSGRVLLPDCEIANLLVEERRTMVIRRFLLDAELPRFRIRGKTSYMNTGSVPIPARPPSSALGVFDSDLAPPKSRERKLSTFLLRTLESINLESHDDSGKVSQLSAEQAREALDFAVISLTYEATLVLNGTRSNRRLVQASCKIVSRIVPNLTASHWEADEKLLVLLGLEPLITAEEENEVNERWEAMSAPDSGTGIRREVLNAMFREVGLANAAKKRPRRELQRIIWQSADVQDAFADAMLVLKDFLRASSGDRLGASSARTHRTDDEDFFVPDRSTHIGASESQFQSSAHTNPSLNTAIQICISFLALAPILQSSSGESTRDKELVDVVLDSAAEQFLVIGSAFLDNVRHRTLDLNVTNIGRFLEKFEPLLQQYTFSHDVHLQVLIIHFLDATLETWSQPSIAASQLGEQVRILYEWLSQRLSTGKIRAWRIRDRMAQFLGRYVSIDPSQQAISMGLDGEHGDSGDTAILPSIILPLLGGDEDVRVCFRVATINAKLFSLMRSVSHDPMKLYTTIIASLCTDLIDYEKMAVRTLCLGNIMILSAEVRRGAYWNLLEASLMQSLSEEGPASCLSHIESVLRGVAERMGLANFSDLFLTYAAPIASAVRQRHHDFLRFSPNLLGFQDRRQCAEATFLPFAIANVVDGGRSVEDVVFGERLFLNHCKAIQKSVSEGVMQCFPEMVGCQIVIWMDRHLDADPDDTSDPEKLLRTTTSAIGDMFDDMLHQRADVIVVAILRALGDQDYTAEGPIAHALRQGHYSESTYRTFLALIRYRSASDHHSHTPNPPSFSPITIIRALEWYLAREPKADAPAVSYHVLHALFAAIHASCLVNEQVRLLNALSLWIAFRHRHFQEPSLLRTLLNGYTSIMAQIELSAAARSALEWAIELVSKVGERDSRLPDILVQICCIAHDFSRNGEDAMISKLGVDLVKWIEAQTLALCRSDVLRPAIVERALPAWPREPCAELAEMSADTTADGLSSVLGDARITANKFRMVRRLRDVALAGDVTADRFAQADFWRLKDCIPAGHEIQDEDIDAFATLLLLHKGHVEAYANDQATAQGLLSRHRRASKKKEPGVTLDYRALPYRPIVQTLLVMVDRAAGSQVYAAYRTLRLLMCGPLRDQMDLKSWSSEYRKELEYLQQYWRAPQTRSARSVTELTAVDTSPKDFALWITEVTVLLADVLSSEDSFYVPLVPLLQTSSAFAEEMLPVLVHTILHLELYQDSSASSARNLLSAFFTSILSSSGSCIPCITTVVNTVLHLRNFMPPRAKDPLAYNQWLSVDFVLLSRSAVACGSYTTALLFLELALEHSTRTPGEQPLPEDVLYDIYSHIGEPDGFYGIKTSDLRQFLVKRLHHEKQWDKAFQFHGAAMEAVKSDQNEMEGVLQSLHAFGFNRLALSTLHENFSADMPSIGGRTAIMSYSIGWRTETWDLPQHRTEQSSSAALYTAFKAVHRERDDLSINDTVRSMLVQEMTRLKSLGNENVTEIREVTRTLMCLSQMGQWRSRGITTNFQSYQINDQVWEGISSIDPDLDFSDLEAIMATRVSLIRAVLQKEQREQIGQLITPFARCLIEAEQKCLIMISEAARESRHLQVAMNSVMSAQTLETVPTPYISQEFASVLWLHKEQKLAIQLLKQLLNVSNTSSPRPTTIDPLTDAGLIARLGAWVAEACLEKPLEILTNFFDAAVSLLPRVDPADAKSRQSHAAVYRQYAVFAEHQYQAITQSPDVIRWRLYADRKRQEIKNRQEQMQRSQRNSREWADMMKEQKRACAVLEEDEAAFQRHNGTRELFLRQAILMFSRCLEASDYYDDDSALRLCSLWFANFDLPAIQDAVRDALDRVPSRKFVFLAHQLSARMSQHESDQLPECQEHLQTLLTRMCKQHPFHSLYQVFCLIPTRPSPEPTSSHRRHSTRLEPAGSQIGRVTAARGIFDRLRNDEVTGLRVRNVEYLCKASLEWAQLPIKRDKRYDKRHNKGPYPVPDSAAILTIRDLPVPVITAHTPVDPSMQYTNCVWISRYESTFQTAGGINLPKISVCLGTDGRPYRQLFKGEGDDDLRQDAVMEQVFDLVNVVLRRDRETRRQKLSVRGYKVIPLAPQAGILEFVGNTQPLQGWLFAAHTRYRPQDITPNETWQSIQAKRAATANKPNQAEELHAHFCALLERFRPVMRHYFTERHKTPMSWFALRLNYSRSVATNSIVGHILGLGDRHTSNILIDNGTGEVVHIDLGIAFEQGKLLPIPERVPFRMTADMVDGLGSSGTQGVFQRCAEETLRVLRDGSEVILTVLEVFRHDPLHSWTANEVKFKRVQEAAPLETIRHIFGIDIANGSADEAADRALNTVKRKLDKSLSVEYTVNELLAEATDTFNLANMFQGWGPYL